MTTFYIVRHAEIQRTAGDPGITERGRAQAQLVGKFLKQKAVARVYTSPLQRARNTAALLAEQLKVPLKVDYRLRERINWGDLPDQTWEDFASEWNKGDADPEYTAPGGLSPRVAAERMADFIENTAELFSGQALALVSHGGIIGDFVARCFDPEDITRFQPDWPALHSDVIDYTSITTVQWTRAKLILLSFAAQIT